MHHWEVVRPPVVPAILAAALVITSVPAVPAGTGSRPLPLFVRGAVERSVALAQARLRNGECRAIYRDFSDLDGRPLAERFERTGTSPSEHLATLRWVNGSEHPTCRNPDVFFVTVVGAGEVNVCPRQFSEYAIRQPIKAAGLVLHEQLHALGLGENPPTSQDISRQVFRRCGR